MIHNRYFLRDDRETEVCIDYTLRGGSGPSGMFGTPEHYDPGSPPEVEIDDAWIERIDSEGMGYAESVKLTDKEYDRFELEVIEDPSTWEPDDDRDY